MKELLIIFILFCALVCLSACMLPKTKEEQMLDDEAQMKYLKEIKENKKKHYKKYKLDNKVRGQVCLKVAEDNNV